MASTELSVPSFSPHARMPLNVRESIISIGQGAASAYLVYGVLSEHANRSTGSCFPSLQTISRKSGLSERNVQLILRRLESLGAISIQSRHDANGRQRSNSYTLPDLQLQAAEQPPGREGAMGCAGEGAMGCAPLTKVRSNQEEVIPASSLPKKLAPSAPFKRNAYGARGANGAKCFFLEEEDSGIVSEIADRIFSIVPVKSDLDQSLGMKIAFLVAKRVVSENSLETALESVEQKQPSNKAAWFYRAICNQADEQPAPNFRERLNKMGTPRFRLPAAVIAEEPGHAAAS